MLALLRNSLFVIYISVAFIFYRKVQFVVIVVKHRNNKNKMKIKIPLNMSS